jgi:regulator of RNase E activity RraB
VPRDDIDLPNYTPEQLEKQCDLEIIKVTTARCEKTEQERGKKAVYYRRKSTLEVNEDGMIERLMKEIRQMSEKYGANYDEAMTAFGALNCSKKALEEWL